MLVATLGTSSAPHPTRDTSTPCVPTKQTTTHREYVHDDLRHTAKQSTSSTNRTSLLVTHDQCLKSWTLQGETVTRVRVHLDLHMSFHLNQNLNVTLNPYPISRDHHSLP